MKFSLAVAMIPLSQLVALAKVAEECGFSSITMPDSLFFPERGATGYPYTADGVRMWDAKTPFVDPMIAAAFMDPERRRFAFIRRCSSSAHAILCCWQARWGRSRI